MLIIGCALMWLVLLYIARYVGGWQMRSDEAWFIRNWLRDEHGKRKKRHGLPHNLQRCDGALGGREQADLARRFPNGGEPFVILNLDRVSSPFSWWICRRQLRLIDVMARREGVPMFPIPFNAWHRAEVSYEGATFHLVQRKRRECVFARTIGVETVYYLSGFDRNERWGGLYFLTQLPRPVTSIKDAREALKPGSVILAEQARRRVYRQGDMFAIATMITSEQIEERGGTIEASGLLYGTAHVADLVATLPDGTQLARGTLRHKPHLIGQLRPADHRPRRLTPRRWHVVAKNTTPMSPPVKEPEPRAYSPASYYSTQRIYF